MIRNILRILYVSNIPATEKKYFCEKILYKAEAVSAYLIHVEAEKKSRVE